LLVCLRITYNWRCYSFKREKKAVNLDLRGFGTEKWANFKCIRTINKMNPQIVKKIHPAAEKDIGLMIYELLCVYNEFSDSYGVRGTRPCDETIRISRQGRLYEKLSLPICTRRLADRCCFWIQKRTVMTANYPRGGFWWRSRMHLVVRLGHFIAVWHWFSSLGLIGI